MPPSFALEVITPDRTVFSGAVVSVVAPGSEGYLGVLANHAPLITTLTIGEAHATTADGDEIYFAVNDGFFQVADNRAILLADSAERADEIDVERAEAARQRAQQERAAHRQRRDDVRFARAEAALRRALNRLHVAHTHAPQQE